jgi:hypothetical protein
MGKRVCAADVLGLGYRPGFTYVNSWTGAFTVLGYDRHGAVIVRDAVTGIEKAHMTSKDRFPGDTRTQLVPEMDNIFGWDVRVVRQHREKVTS